MRKLKTDKCYEKEKGDLICDKEEDEDHEHSDECYEWEEVLTCDKEESEGHKHTDKCYSVEKVAVCGELELHTHDEKKCYDKDGNLICGQVELVEHIHNEDCFKTVELSKEEVAQLNEEPAAEESAQAEESISTDTDLAVASATDTVEESATVEEDAPAEESAEGRTEEELPSQEVYMPAASFEERTEGLVNQVRVSVVAPEGAFPAGTTMRVAPVESDEVFDAINDAVRDEIVRVQAVDITFYDAKGQEIEPQAPIQVAMTSEVVKETDSPVVVHVDDSGKGEVVEQMSGKEQKAFEAEREQALAEDEVAFSAENFSVYAVVYTVDFHFEGYDYSMPGGTSIKLSQVFKQLDIDRNAADAVNITFTNESLVEVKQTEDDWELVSLEPFDTEEKLTVVFKNGDTLVIDVTDAQSSNAVLKITDSNGAILYEMSRGRFSTSYSQAVYDSLTIANIEPINRMVWEDRIFCQKSGTKYSEYKGPINIEFLTPGVKLESPQCFVKAEERITFKTASKTATDGFPYRGSNSTATILCTPGLTSNSFVLRGENAEYVFQNLILDGCNIKANEGPLIKVGDRGNKTYHSTVRLESDTTLRHGLSNHDDQGGAVFVGKGGKFYMEPGSLIKDCRNNNGCYASGGAIYLAKGEFYCNGGVIEGCTSIIGGAVDLGGGHDCGRSDEARIYLSGTPKIISNYSDAGKAMNVHLNYDSNEIINIVGNMSDEARVGISVNEDPTIFNNHGKEGMPFATISSGVSVNPLSFVNDRDTSLSAMRSTTNEKLAVWYYPLVTDVVEDYYIDDVKRSTTTVVDDDIYKLDNTKSYTDTQLAEEYAALRSPAVSKDAVFDYIEVLEHTDVCGERHPAIKKVTNIRFVGFGGYGARRWEVSTDNGTNWQGVSGRQMVIHYRRDVRCEVNVTAEESTDQNKLLSGAQFTLERADAPDMAYATYTGDFENGEAGVYTCGESGSFKMNLPEGYYRLRETTVPEGYRAAPDASFKIEVSSSGETITDTTGNPQYISFANQPQSANVTLRQGEDRKAETASGTFTVLDDRAVSVNILEIQEDGSYELRNDWRAFDKLYMTVNGPVTPDGQAADLKDALNPDVRKAHLTDYKKLHTYYGSSPSDLHDTEVESLTAAQRQGIQVNGSKEELLELEDQLYFIYFKNPVDIPVYYAKAKGLGLEMIPKDNLNLSNGNAVASCQASDEKSHVQDKLLGTPSKAVKNRDDIDTSEYYFALGPANVNKASEFNLAVDQDQDIWFYNAYDGIHFSDHDEDYRVRGTKPHELALYIVYGKRMMPVTVHKVWQDGDGSQVDHSSDTVYFTLTPQGEDVMVNPNPIEGMDEHLFSIESGTNGEWTTVVEAIPAESYTVSEQLVKGYATTYKTSADKDGNPVITITNIRGVELPSTGGPGTYLYTIGGTAILACGLLYGLQLWRRREGAAE